MKVWIRFEIEFADGYVDCEKYFKWDEMPFVPHDGMSLFPDSNKAGGAFLTLVVMDDGTSWHATTRSNESMLEVECETHRCDYKVDSARCSDYIEWVRLHGFTIRGASQKLQHKITKR